MSDRAVDLLIYTDGMLVTPDDLILIKLQDSISTHGRGPFRRVWFTGEKACQEIAD